MFSLTRIGRKFHQRKEVKGLVTWLSCVGPEKEGKDAAVLSWDGKKPEFIPCGKKTEGRTRRPGIKTSAVRKKGRTAVVSTEVSDTLPEQRCAPTGEKTEEGIGRDPA